MNVALTLQSEKTSVTIGHDGFSIGASPQCDLTLEHASLPPLHSVIHHQAGAIWIETTNDSSVLLVNGKPYRRMALRHDDRLTIGSAEFTFRMVPQTKLAMSESMMNEDLTLLTAEELCDRILSEQSMVAEFAEGQRSGWEALLRAIEAANDEESMPEELLDTQFEESHEDQAAINTLLEQIEELNATITDRTRELADREAEVLESTSMLEESQQRVAERIDEILDQLDKNDPPNELRASA